jgi:protein-L-isoaspartate(D-aspartate) O-methyltransferase
MDSGEFENSYSARSEQGRHSHESGNELPSPNAFAKARQRMLKRDLEGRDITDRRVLKVMAEIPREEFIPQSWQSQAYADGPLPIGMGQTISQPYIVALMTQELRVNKDCEVLEIGTGSGYQTAVLSKLVKKVYTVERFAQLSESAQAVLGRLGVSNVEFYVGDGSCGWPKSRLPPSKCFDRIMITAAVPKIPEPLAKQLADGGLIVAPVGYGGVQELVACEKKANKIIERLICDVRFVKLLGEYGFEE